MHGTIRQRSRPMRTLVERVARGSCGAGRCWPASLTYAPITAVLGRHVLAHPSTTIVHDVGDPLLTAALLHWNAWVVPLTHAWWQFPIFHPTPDALAFSEHLLGLSVVATPIEWVAARSARRGQPGHAAHVSVVRPHGAAARPPADGQRAPPRFWPGSRSRSPPIARRRCRTCRCWRRSGRRWRCWRCTRYLDSGRRWWLARVRRGVAAAGARQPL